MKSLEELAAIRAKMLEQVSLRKGDNIDTRIVVGMATCGIAAGARPVMLEFIEELKRRGIENATVSQTGCVGVCRLEPIVEVYVKGQEKVTYVHMTPEKVARAIHDGKHVGRAPPRINEWGNPIHFHDVSRRRFKLFRPINGDNNNSRCDVSRFCRETFVNGDDDGRFIVGYAVSVTYFNRLFCRHLAQFGQFGNANSSFHVSHKGRFFDSSHDSLSFPSLL